MATKKKTETGAKAKFHAINDEIKTLSRTIAATYKELDALEDVVISLEDVSAALKDNRQVLIRILPSMLEDFPVRLSVKLAECKDALNRREKQVDSDERVLSRLSVKLAECRNARNHREAPDTTMSENLRCPHCHENLCRFPPSTMS